MVDPSGLVAHVEAIISHVSELLKGCVGWIGHLEGPPGP
jgi:hypothetical protein